MNSRQQLRRRFLLSFQKGDAVTVALAFQGIVSDPAVGVNDAAAFNGLLHERHQALGRSIGDAPHANAPDPVSIFLRRNNNQRLVLDLPPANVRLLAAPVGLVHLHYSRETVPARSHHGPPKFMEPSPRGIVTPQAQHPLQPYSAGTVFLAGDCPHRTEPNRQWFTGVLKDRPCRHRTLIAATCTLQQHHAYWPSLPPTTPRTPKPIRPPQPDQILPAGRLCRKARFKFSQIPWIILHSTPYYILGSPESSRYSIYDHSESISRRFRTKPP